MTQPRTRDRIVDVSAVLFRRQGYAGTGLKQIVAAAGTPFGSLYHHFPSGKQQLGEEVIRSSGAAYLRLFVEIADASPNVAVAVRRFFKGAAGTLAETDYADACPIATIAMEVASTNDTLRQAAAEVFESWIEELVMRLRAEGLTRRAARPVAITVLCSLEGAFVFSRSLRSIEPMLVAGRTAEAVVRAALPTGSRKR